MALGNFLLGPQGELNPFSPPPISPTNMGVPGATPPIIPNPTPETPEKKSGYIQGWKNFIGRIKEDPDLRVALLQVALNATQPAATWQEGIGRALAGGVQTFDALKQQRAAAAQQERENAQTDRQLGQTDRRIDQGDQEIGIRQGQLEQGAEELRQRGDQFSQNLEQQRRELDARLKQIEGDIEYKRALVRLERDKGATGEQGQVNQRWTTMTNLVKELNPSFTDAQARAYAWNVMNPPDQDAQKLKAQLLSDQQIFFAERERGESDEAYNQRFNQELTRRSSILDRMFTESGYGSDPTLTTLPGMSPQPAPVSPPAPSAPPAAAPAPAAAAPTASSPSSSPPVDIRAMAPVIQQMVDQANPTNPAAPAPQVPNVAQVQVGQNLVASNGQAAKVLSVTPIGVTVEVNGQPRTISVERLNQLIAAGAYNVQ